MLSLNWERDFWKKAAAKQVFIYLQDHRLCLEFCKKGRTVSVFENNRRNNESHGRTGGQTYVQGYCST